MRFSFAVVTTVGPKYHHNQFWSSIEQSGPIPKQPRRHLFGENDLQANIHAVLRVLPHKETLVVTLSSVHKMIATLDPYSQRPLTAEQVPSVLCLDATQQRDA